MYSQAVLRKLVLTSQESSVDNVDDIGNHGSDNEDADEERDVIIMKPQHW